MLHIKYKILNTSICLSVYLLVFFTLKRYSRQTDVIKKKIKLELNGLNI